MEDQQIDAKDARPGMQVRVAGVWWQLTEIMREVNGQRTFAVRAKRVRNDGFTTGAAPRLIWLDKGPITVRAGVPAESSIIDGKHRTLRVVLMPRHARDPEPYLAADGSRHSKDETASGRLVAGLVEAYQRGWTA